MKNNIIIAVIALLVLGFFVFNGVDSYIEELNRQIISKDERIELLMKSDSAVYEETKKYSETITKYIRDCNVVIGDKTYGFSEFINLYINEIDKRNKIQDSLYKLKLLYDVSVLKYGEPYTIQKNKNNEIKLVQENTKADTALAYLKVRKNLENEAISVNDSFFVYRSMIKHLESRFNIRSKYSIKDKSIDFSFIGIEKIDSAMALLPYYRHRLSLDGNTWTIEVDDEYTKNIRRQKRLEKRNKKNTE